MIMCQYRTVRDVHIKCHSELNLHIQDLFCFTCGNAFEISISFSI